MADEVPDEEKLDKLEEDIQKARTHADEAVAGLDVEPKESFADSGSEDKGEDDQTIAPG
ncbi:MAG: hypothetical protein M3159_07275 [Actinomycetota bacterium]|nr:hypothetical protein [Actinomycetota bacterium]